MARTLLFHYIYFKYHKTVTKTQLYLGLTGRKLNRLHKCQDVLSAPREKGWDSRASF